MSKEDWIILRLISPLLKTFKHQNEATRRDCTKTLVYLINKYGADFVSYCAMQLSAEES
jgi:hypothetical protein